MFHDIPLREQNVLFKFGIEVFFHPYIFRILCPAHEVGDCHLWTICIKYLEPVSLIPKIVTHFGKSRGSFSRKKSDRFIISCDPVPYKVVCRIITYFKNHVRNGLAYKDKVRGIIRIHKPLFILVRIFCRNLLDNLFLYGLIPALIRHVQRYRSTPQKAAYHTDYYQYSQ